MKKVIILLCLIVMLLNIVCINSLALSAQSTVVIDANSGRILYSHNAQNKMGMASTTKIMTAITALENADINSVATVSPNAYGVEGSSMYLVLGEQLSLENLLWGLMLVSGNDAATAVAEHVSGSVEKFAVLMNTTAQKIGAVNSNFTNPHGLSDENHYTTAHDLAKITAYALKNPKFREIVSTRTKSIPWKNHDYNRHLVNHNKFLTMYDGCIGVKTGFTKATGRCLVTAVEKDGMCLVCVTLNAPDDWNDHKTLYDSAFAEYIPHTIKNAASHISSAKIKNGTADTVALTVDRDIIIPVKTGEEDKITTKVIPFEDLQAPVKKGDILGTFVIEIGGQPTGEFPVIAAESVELKNIIFRPTSGNLWVSLTRVFRAWITCFN